MGSMRPILLLGLAVSLLLCGCKGRENAVVIRTAQENLRAVPSIWADETKPVEQRVQEVAERIHEADVLLDTPAEFLEQGTPAKPAFTSEQSLTMTKDRRLAVLAGIRMKAQEEVDSSKPAWAFRDLIGGILKAITGADGLATLLAGGGVVGTAIGTALTVYQRIRNSKVTKSLVEAIDTVAQLDPKDVEGMKNAKRDLELKQIREGVHGPIVAAVKALKAEKAEKAEQAEKAG